MHWRQKSPAQIGHVRGFYDYAPDSSPDASADEAFMRLENDFPRTRDAIRRDGYASWTRHRDVLVSFAAMLTARSPLFREQSSAEIFPPLTAHPQGAVLAKNYAITNMRAEILRRGAEWKSYYWALSYTTTPEEPVITCDHPIAMRSDYADQRVAYEKKDFWLLFPVAWDMCLVGSTVPLDGELTRQFDPEHLRELAEYIRKQAGLFIVSPVQLTFPPH